MNPLIKRREFLIKGSRAGAACCAMMLGAHRFSSGMPSMNPSIPDRSTIAAINVGDCRFLQASVKNDPELKKRGLPGLEDQEKYNIDFDAEKSSALVAK